MWRTVSPQRASLKPWWLGQRRSRRQEGALSGAALRSTFALCSDADIRALKEVAFDSSYMSDVGRIQDDHLLCSALWGRIVPFKLPAPRYSSGETKLWNTSDLVGSPYGGTNLIAQGRTFTVSSPSSFDGLDPARTSTFTVETRDRSYVFRRVVAATDVSENTSSRIGLSRCSNKANACAFVSRPRRGVWDLAPLCSTPSLGWEPRWALHCRTCSYAATGLQGRHSSTASALPCAGTRSGWCINLFTPWWIGVLSGLKC